MLEQVINRYPSKKVFCQAIGMSPQFLAQIQRGLRPLPVRYALAIERATCGDFTAAQLRPDIFGLPKVEHSEAA